MKNRFKTILNSNFCSLFFSVFDDETTFRYHFNCIISKIQLKTRHKVSTLFIVLFVVCRQRHNADIRTFFWIRTKPM